MLGILFSLAEVFVRYPLWAYVVAFGFAVLGLLAMRQQRIGKIISSVVAAAAWVLFGILNTLFQDGNIRVDLLVSLPVVAVCTLVCVGFWILDRRPTGLSHRNESAQVIP